MPFDKGTSGNPGGRPKKSEEQRKFERRCREWADTMGFDKLRRWADMDDFDKSFPALKEIFNRGFGRAIETQVIDANVTAEPSPSVADLEREAADLLGAGKAPCGAVDGEAAVGPRQ